MATRTVAAKPEDATGSSPASIRALLFIVFAALAVPVLAVRLPPVTDYPNHWARLSLLLGAADTAPLNAIYAVEWRGAWSNIAVDLIAVTLGRLTGAELIGPIVLLCAVMLPPLGAAALHRATFGAGGSWWALGFPVLAWNATLAAGLLNFQIGIGCALLAAAAGARGFPGRAFGTAVAHAVIGTALGALHIFAAFFYAVLLAGLAFGPDARFRSFWNLDALRRAALATVPAVAPILAILLLTPAVPGLGPAAAAIPLWEQYSVLEKVAALITGVVAYDPLVEVVFVVGLWAVARLLCAGGVLRMHGGLALLALPLMLIALLIPPFLGGTALTDWRFPIMAALVLAAACRPAAPTHRRAVLAVTVLVLLSVGRSGWILSVWSARAADAAAVERTFAHLPPGAAVLPAVPLLESDIRPPTGRAVLTLATFLHLPQMAIPQRRVFVPTLFTGHSTTPVHMRPPLHVRHPWREIAGDAPPPIFIPFLARIPDGALFEHWFGYAREWRTRFDFILVLNADLSASSLRGLDLPELELIADEGFARLYRIRRSAGG